MGIACGMADCGCMGIEPIGTSLSSTATKVKSSSAFRSGTQIGMSQKSIPVAES